MKRVLPLVLLLLTACATPGPPTRPNDREWNVLLHEHQWIEALRNSTPPQPQGTTRKKQIETLLDTYRKVEPMYDKFIEKLREYYERTLDVRAAKLFATEKVRIGDHYMSVLARYDRAIGMYQAALAIDPENAAAKQRLSEAQRLRFVSMDSFAGVRNGMPEAEVQRILGVPREDWIKQVVQKNRVYTVWIYPKQDGGASAVYFDNGVVYHTNWNAAPAKNASAQ